MKKVWFVATILVIAGVLLSGCARAADTASYNISAAADNFEINRRITLYNGITDKVIQVVEGRCSLGNNDTEPWISITCKISPTEFIKNYWRVSDNILAYSEQLGTAKVNDWHYRVIFRPETLIPGVELDTSLNNP